MKYDEVQSGPKIIIFGVLFLVVFISSLMFTLQGSSIGTIPSLVLGSTVIIIAVLLFSFRLETKIDQQDISLKMPLLLNEKISIKEIQNIEAYDYKPLREFGGWGIRYGKNGSMMYSAKGNKAVKLTLKDGKIIFIGTMRQQEFISAIQNKITNN